MKYINAILLIIVITMPLPGQEAPVTEQRPEGYVSLIPSRSYFVIELTDLQRTEETVGFLSKNIRSSGHLDNITNLINFIKILEKSKGSEDKGPSNIINTNNPVYIASILKSGLNNDTIIFLPLKNQAKFPVLFINSLKEINKKPDIDLNPVITEYRNYKIYQILKDIFFTVIDSCFILTSSGDIVKEIINIKGDENSKNVLVNDASFTDFLKKRDRGFPVNIFIKGKFLSLLNIETLFDYESLLKLNVPEKPENEASALPDEKSKGDDTKNKQVRRSRRYDFIDYLGLGFNYTPGKIETRVYLLTDIKNTLGKLISQLFVTGYAEKCLYVPDPVAYAFLSADLKSLSDSFKEPENRRNILLPLYGKLNYYLKKNFGINMDTEFTPYFGNLMNIMLKKSEKRRRYDNYLVFYPVVNSADNNELYQSYRSSVKKIYKKPGTFGDDKIGDIDTFWFADRMGNKNYFVLNNNKFFLMNDVELFREVTVTSDKNVFDINNDFTKSITGDSFLNCYVKFDDESLVKMTIGMALLNIHPGFSGIIEKIDDLLLTGNKIENYFTFHFTINILSDNK